MNKKVFLSGIICFGVLILVLMLTLGKDRQPMVTTVTIAVLRDSQVQDFDTNYYTGWLEQQTGYNIKFEYITPGSEREYLHEMLLTDEGRIDAVFLPERDILTREELTAYADAGLIEELGHFAAEDSSLKQYLNDCTDKSLNLLENDDGIYYMPRADESRKKQNLQILWININWLKQLSLKVPETTEELREVLIAFRDKDPNGNGVADELPMIYNISDNCRNSCWVLLNAFAYTNPESGFLYADGSDIVHDTCITEEFRNGLKYCHSLYDEGLLCGDCAGYNERQLKELVSGMSETVGAFTGRSIADIIYPNSSDVLAKYIQVPPLEGPQGERNAVRIMNMAEPGGYIPANAKHKREAFEIMDIMLSAEGSCIAAYGEENTDWRRAKTGELSDYGTRATITTINYLADKVQNKNFHNAGPMYLSDEYANGTTWKGNDSFLEYFDTRAVRVYENYYRDDIFAYSEEVGKAVAAVDKKATERAIEEFINGRRNIASDEAWESFVKERRGIYAEKEEDADR